MLSKIQVSTHSLIYDWHVSPWEDVLISAVVIQAKSKGLWRKTKWQFVLSGTCTVYIQKISKTRRLEA